MKVTISHILCTLKVPESATTKYTKKYIVCILYTVYDTHFITYKEEYLYYKYTYIK